MIGDFLLNRDYDYVGNYLVEIDCNYYHHEFVKKAI